MARYWWQQLEDHEDELAEQMASTSSSQQEPKNEPFGVTPTIKSDKKVTIAKEPYQISIDDVLSGDKNDEEEAQ